MDSYYAQVPAKFKPDVYNLATMTTAMTSANQILDQQFFEMRWRVLSLAADFDRIQRAGGAGALVDDPRLSKLHEALGVLTSGEHGRAARVQMIFSDQSPGPQ